MDGELPGVEHRQIHEHIGQCAMCAQEYRSLLQMKRLLAGMQVRESNADLPARLLEKVHAQHPVSPTRRSWLQNLQGSASGNSREGLPVSLAERLRTPQPRFQYLAIAATLSIVGIVYTSYAIDRADKIQWRDTAPTEIASLPPASVDTSDPMQSLLPAAVSTQNAPWQPEGSARPVPYSDLLLRYDSAPHNFSPPARRVWPAPSFFNPR